MREHLSRGGMEPGVARQVHEAGVWGRWGGDKACLAMGTAVEVSRSWGGLRACREQEVWLEPHGEGQGGPVRAGGCRPAQDPMEWSRGVSWVQISQLIHSTACVQSNMGLGAPEAPSWHRQTLS